MKNVLPEDVSTAPLEGASREPQSIAVKIIIWNGWHAWTIVGHTWTRCYRLPHLISHTGSRCCGDSIGDFISTDTGVGHCPLVGYAGWCARSWCSRRSIGDRGRGTTVHSWVSKIIISVIGIDSEHTHHNNIREQVGRGPHIPLARQVAVAMVTPVETSYPLTQV